MYVDWPRNCGGRVRFGIRRILITRDEFSLFVVVQLPYLLTQDLTKESIDPMNDQRAAPEVLSKRQAETRFSA
jgi:hypothetical protein